MVLFLGEWKLFGLEQMRSTTGKGTIQPGLRLVPSGIFFLALNRRHHFLLKKVRI